MPQGTERPVWVDERVEELGEKVVRYDVIKATRSQKKIPLSSR